MFLMYYLVVTFCVIATGLCSGLKMTEDDGRVQLFSTVGACDEAALKFVRKHEAMMAARGFTFGGHTCTYDRDWNSNLRD